MEFIIFFEMLKESSDTFFPYGLEFYGVELLKEKAGTPTPTPMETSETETVPEKKSDKIESDESKDKKDGGEQQKNESEHQSEKSDERTAEPEANGTAGEEDKDSSQKAKGILFNSMFQIF